MATPTLVQRKSDTAEASPAGGAVSTWKVNLSNPSQAGNCIVAVVFSGLSGQTISVADDKSNSWTGTTQIDDATNNTALRILFAKNVAANTQLLTITFGTASSFNQVELLEFSNVDTVNPLDVQIGANNASGTALTTGSMTTNNAGELIIEAAVIDNFPAQTTTMTWTPGTNFTMATMDNATYMAVQYQVQGAAGPINSSITSSISATNAVTKAIALKSASAGSDLPAGIRVRSIQVMSLENGTTYATYSGTAFKFQVQVTGNLVALGWTGRPSVKPTSITSTPALTWSHTSSSSDTSSGSLNSVWWWYAVGATPGTLYTFTVNFASTPSAAVFNFFDISGADNSSPFDTFVSANGTNTTHPTFGENGVVINGPSITPSTANGLILTVQQEDQNTVVNASPGSFQAIDVGLYSGSAGDTDEGLALYYNPNTSAVQVQWTYNGYESAVTGTGPFCSQAIAFKAAPASSVASGPLQKQNYGSDGMTTFSNVVG